MEVEEVTNLSVAPIVATPFAIQWSENACLSILTERGVHILELSPTPTSSQPMLKFNRSFIYSPDFAPGEIFTEKAGEQIWDLERDDLYSLLMQESLTPNLNGLTPAGARITKVCWSPKNIVYPNKCLIAILTATGCCLVLRQMSGEWYIAFSLSEQKLADSCEKETSNNDKGVKNIEELEKVGASKNDEPQSMKNNEKPTSSNSKHDPFSKSPNIGTSTNEAMLIANKLIVTAITWSTDWNPCYALAAYKNNTVVIYKVPTLCNTNPITPSIMGQIEVEETVNQICWISKDKSSPLVVVSDFKGNICGYVLEDSSTALQVKKKEIYYNYGDKILVTNINVLLKNDEMIVAATKGTFLILLVFNEKTEFLCFKYMQVDGFPISGITRIKHGEALLTTDNGLLYHCIARNLECREIKVERSSHTKERFLGIAISPSRALIAYVSSPATLYDHLVYREPSKLIFIALKTTDPMTIFTNNPSQSLGEVWDSLELLRIRATRTLKLPEFSNVESLSKYELKIYMWISIMNEIILKKNLIKRFTVTDDPFEPQLNVFVYSICDFVEKLLQKDMPDKEEVTAVNNIEMYLEVFLAAEEDGQISKKAEETLTKIKQKVKERRLKRNPELCTLCNTVIVDVPWKATRCTQGHVLPRCSLTLLQVTTVNQKMCKICQQIFHPLVGDTTCPYCDIPLVVDGRVTAVPYEIGKSLSRKIGSTVVSEPTETEFL